MLIIHALGIWEGGGKSYFSYIAVDLGERTTHVFIDKRLDPVPDSIKNAKIIRVYPGICGLLTYVFHRHLLLLISNIRYIFSQCTNEIPHEYFLNGIPPLISYPGCRQFTFIVFQNRIIFEPDSDYSCNIKDRIRIHLIRLLVVTFSSRYFNYIVQTPSMCSAVKGLLPNVRSIKISTPVYHKLASYKNKRLDAKDIPVNIKKLRTINPSTLFFFYPASGLPHKNHLRLFKAFSLASKLSLRPIFLLLTINPEIISNDAMYSSSMITLGSLSQQQMSYYYENCDALVFPSLIESLGLPLIEATAFNLPIIASNLGYVFDVCKPLMTFNPYSILSITSSICYSQESL